MSDETTSATAVWSRQEVLTGVAALLMFYLFIGAVFWLHRVADANSEALGISTWAEKAATEDRVKRTLDATLRQKSLATWLATDSAIVDRIGDKHKDNPAIAWKALDAAAEALTEDSPRQHLARLWADELSLRKDAIHALARAGVAAPDEATRATALAAEYTATLSSVLDSWLATELAALRIDMLLSDASAKAASVPDAESVRAGAKPEPALAALVARIHTRAKAFLTSNSVNAEITKAVAEDLDPFQAQSTIASAVHKDFAARAMWIISAALFLTFAVSVTLGAIPRVLKLVESTHPWSMGALFVVVALVAGWTGHRLVSGLGPDFLSRPIRELEVAYGIGLEPTVRLLNVIAFAAIAALFVTAGASFLIPTRDDDHLDTQFATLRWVLHAATLVLVAGVLETYALTHWPTAFMADPAAAMVEGGAQIAALAIGAVLSTLLLLLYVPGALVLREAARGLKEAARDLEADKKKERIAEIDAIITLHGFDTSTTKLIGTFAQLLLPLIITVPLGTVVSLLGS